MFNPDLFLNLATELHTQNNREECVRGAVGRAYYAAFLSAREKSGVSTTTKEVHAEVIAYCRTISTQLANSLDSLRLHRNSADYNLAKKFSSSDSHMAIQRAKSIIKDLP